MDGTGFPFEPGFLNKNLVTFDTLTNNRCLVLFGEPGIGKTTVLADEYRAAEKAAIADGNAAMFRDLGIYSSDAALIHDIFEDESFLTWVSGSHELELYLDSLDECRLRVESIDALLLSRLKRYDRSRLRLRISCRTADWTTILQKGMPELWSTDQVAQYQLAPLSREHLKVAAIAECIDPHEFIRQVQEKQVGGLAIKPVTLRMLLAIYLEHGTFPSHQSEIFREGCLLLADESNESRIAAQRVGSLKAEERLAIAARIAAACAFSNRSLICKRNITEEEHLEVVTLNQLSGAREPVGNGIVEVSEMALLETLGTALFETAQDGQGFRSSHQTYAEFLTAWYLKQRGLSADRVMTLLMHPTDPEHRIVPQLYEVAAQVAHIIPGAQELILRHDPEVLVRSDMTASSAEEREAAVEALLKMYAEERAHEPWHLYLNYTSFAHPRLAAQLQPYLIENHWNIEVRRLAISLIEDCKVSELQQELADLALDDSQPMMVRVKAAMAVKEIGDRTIKKELRPLIYKDINNDKYGDLRGAAFMAVWPEHMTADELFKFITHPSDSLGNLYSVFLSSHLVPHLKPADLPIALRWVMNEVSHHSSFKAQSLADEIVLKSWEHLDDQGVIDAFTDLFISRLRGYNDVLTRSQYGESKEVIRADDLKRKRLLKALLSKLTNPEAEWRPLLRSQFLAFSESDVEWLLDMLDETDSITGQQVLAKIIRSGTWSPEPSLLSKLLGVCQRNPTLAIEFNDLLCGVQLNSLSAEALRANHDEIQKWQAKSEERETLTPPPAERILNCLKAVEEGNLGGWVKLNLEITLEETSVTYQHEDVLDIKLLPGWMAADDPTRSRIIFAAEKFVVEHSPNRYEWLVEFPDPRWVLASQRAWFLLMRECSEFVSGLDSQVWETWGHFLVINPLPEKNEAIIAAHDTLIKLAHQKARLDIAEGLYAKLNYDDRKRGATSLFHNIENYWNEAFVRKLIKRISDQELSLYVLRSSLGWLLRHKVRAAQLFAESLLPYPLPRLRRDRERAMIAAHMLLVYGEDASWPVVWRAVETDRQFGRELLLRAASSIENKRTSIAPRLNEQQLADLYIRLAREFPHAEDPHHVGVYSPTSRDEVMWWRDGILSHLQERGTREACATMERVVKELPHLEFLKHVLLDARSKTRWSTWQPLKPDEVITLLTNEEKRVIQNGDQLLEVLIESLRRLEAKLQGETPAASDLWNEIGARGKSRKFMPKDEDRLSDYVKRHLESDLVGSGIILNREVEIRRGTGKGDGERTDIHVDAVVRLASGNAYDVVRAIIETKGCWNRGLRTAMTDQLVGRYLKDNNCRHGLYLVGWFLCDGWDNADQRKAQTPKMDLIEIQRELDQQAQSLSTEAINVRAVVMNTALR